MVRKQDLVLFLKDKGENINLSDIEEFVKRKTQVSTLGFTQGSIFVEQQSPISFINSADLANKIRDLELADEVTTLYNAIHKPSAAIALTVLRIFVEILGYRIKKVTSTKVVFVKPKTGKMV